MVLKLRASFTIICFTKWGKKFLIPLRKCLALRYDYDEHSIVVACHFLRNIIGPCRVYSADMIAIFVNKEKLQVRSENQSIIPQSEISTPYNIYTLTYLIKIIIRIKLKAR